MKNTIFLLVSALLLSACSLLKPLNEFEKSYSEATAQPWVGGIASTKGSANGVTFRMKFYQLNRELIADTLWVNETPLLTEITVLTDTTYVSAFYFWQGNEPSPLSKASEYSGRLGIFYKGKKHTFGPKPFLKLPVIPYM